MTSREAGELGLAVLGSILGGIAGYYVGKKTHRVLGTAVGLGVGAVAFPAVVEVINKAKMP